MVPRLLEDKQLQAGNALLMGVGQVSVMLGPVLAGLIIAGSAANTSEANADLDGIALVFGLDALGFVIAVFTLVLIRLEGQSTPGAFNLTEMFRSVAEGFAAMWGDVHIRTITLVFTVFSLFWRGPYLVGIPILCEQRFEEGALAFGMIGSAFGLGALIGVVIAGAFPSPPERWYGRLILIDTGLLGASFFVYALTPTLDWALVVTAVTGLADGFITILLISWLQIRVPKAFLGRVMSVIMLFNAGLAPVSAALAGVLIRWSLSGVFIGAGAILVLLSLLGITVPLLRNFAYEKEGEAERELRV